MKLPRTEEHRRKLVKFYMEEKCLFLGKKATDYTKQEFENFYTQTEMISMVSKNQLKSLTNIFIEM